MEKKLNFSYDKVGDILDISLGKPQKAISEEVKEDFYVRLNPKTHQVVGFMILNFIRHSQKKEVSEIPVVGTFDLDREFVRV